MCVVQKCLSSYIFISNGQRPNAYFSNSSENIDNNWLSLTLFRLYDGLFQPSHKLQFAELFDENLQDSMEKNCLPEVHQTYS